MIQIMPTCRIWACPGASQSLVCPLPLKPQMVNFGRPEMDVVEHVCSWKSYWTELKVIQVDDLWWFGRKYLGVPLYNHFGNYPFKHEMTGFCTVQNVFLGVCTSWDGDSILWAISHQRARPEAPGKMQPAGLKLLKVQLHLRATFGNSYRFVYNWLVVEPPLWKILVSWDDYFQYMEKLKMFQTTKQI